MPVELEGTAPTARPGASAGHVEAGPHLTIGLVNIMPDPALEATESQFQGLLRDASREESIRLRLSSFPELPRGAEALERIRAHYWPLERLLAGPLDGLIVTGTEPRTPRLREEPFWARFEQLLRWAPRHTRASIWSCLAAHAAVQILDGIERQRLPEKRSGVYRTDILQGHPLLQGIAGPLRMPHSRWNDLPREALERAGYTILSAAPDCGVDAFAREGPTLFLFFQGHPEYEATTLLREYRRDVGRYLSGQQPHYPSLPHGYFAPEAVTTLDNFREQALADRSRALLERFPFATVSASLRSSWRTAA
ncbi:MAG: homoserine O-succinyltransferase, partial [Gammaproteobacteria bacterium]|nr:homoserine O-succinyltransferase [Gammaproteobacteria bacterium]